MSDHTIERLARAIHELQTQVSGMQRTQQMPRTYVGGTPVEGALAQVGEVVDRVSGLGGDVARLDDGTLFDAWDSGRRLSGADTTLDDLAMRVEDSASVVGSIDAWRGEIASDRVQDAYDRDEASAAVDSVLSDVKASAAAGLMGQELLGVTLADTAGTLADTVYDAGEYAGLVDRLQELAAESGWSGSRTAATIEEAAWEAEKAAIDAAAAQTTADGKNARRQGVTEPPPPAGGWVQGDEWVRLAVPPGETEARPVESLVWNGATFVRSQVLASDLLILGEDGTVAIGNGKVTAPNMSADFYIGRRFIGGGFEGGEFILPSATEIATVYYNDGTNKMGWVGNASGEYPAVVDSAVYRTAPGSLKSGMPATWPYVSIQNNSLSIDVPESSEATIEFWVRAAQAGQVIVYIGSGGADQADIGSTLVDVKANAWTRVVTQAQKTGVRIARVSVTIGRTNSGSQSLWIDEIRVKALTTGVSGARIKREDDGTAVIESTGGSGEITTLINGTLATNQPVNKRDTIAKLNAFNPADGTKAWVEAEQREYVRAGGRWVADTDIARDTAWADLSVPGATGTCQWRRVAGIIYLRFDVTLTTAVAAGAAKDPLAVMPAEAWPAIDSPITMMTQSSYPCTGFVGYTGSIVFRNTHTASMTRFKGSGAWPSK